MARRPHVLILSVLLLAGCAGDPGTPDADPETPGVQGEPAPAFTVTSPGWEVGEWWQHHWVFAGQGGPDFTVKTILAENASGTYTFGTDLEATAAQHGAFFFMDLGTLSPDGTMTAGDYTFPWMQFPLTDNKTWKAQETNVGSAFDPVTRSLDFTARQMGTGADAHFVIEGRQDGDLYVRYDYQPDLHWFSEFTTFTVDANGTETPVYTITNEGHGVGYAGTVFHATGNLLVNEQPLMHPGSTAPPADTVTFDLAADHTHVFAILFSFAAAGGHNTQLLAPDGQHWEAIGAGDADGNPVSPPVVTSGLQLLEPAQAGTWRVNFGGAGVVAGGGCFLWGVAITQSTL